MRKIILSMLVAASLVAGTGVALADKPANPGEKGLCTAFFNGQKNGHDKNGQPGPFQDLQDRAPDGSDEDDEGGSIADLYDYCSSTYGIGGNPDENGRYTTCWTDDDEDASTHSCDD
jgi:hypothetical protein